jgi:hypothetical protein
MTGKIFGISKEDYQGWKHDQVSKVVLKFLSDKQEYLKQAALESWVAGSKSFAECSDTVRGQIIELDEMINLPFDAMVEFYKKEEDASNRDAGK